ncbi:MAG TPA: methyltransferase domain-containing protein [Magnetovibrio sp.]
MSKPAAPRSWNPDQYLTFADQRLRPALDLLARVPLTTATRVSDLGCGPGNVTPFLRQRFPDATLTGVDSSAEMLKAAQETHVDGAAWVLADAARWQPDQPQDLIYSNALMQWLDGHDALLPRLLGFVRPGGALAVQMPNQFGEPSHVLMREVAASGPWADALTPLLRPAPVASPACYDDWLSPYCASVDVWQTEYLQKLSGEDAVLHWLSATALKPLLEALPGEHVSSFQATLAARLRAAYPPRTDGSTLFAFKRLFIVAVRAG